ncbi:uncharacterized protein VTP21DRAFT_6739 [Calcarisporiella thermophila]|uniref:uncharacterized protein n=1 Tax=Calcarisporiella thermophila TaxID=911321 RepID=UPI003743AC5E
MRVLYTVHNIRQIKFFVKINAIVTSGTTAIILIVFILRPLNFLDQSLTCSSESSLSNATSANCCFDHALLASASSRLFSRHLAALVESVIMRR